MRPSRRPGRGRENDSAVAVRARDGHGPCVGVGVAAPTATPTPTVVGPASGAVGAPATRAATPFGVRGFTPEETATAAAVQTATAAALTATASAPTPTPAGTPGTVDQCAGTGGPGNLPDAFEPDDTRAMARPIGDGETHDDHTLCSITTGPDEDWLRFEASPSRRYTVSTSNLSAVVDTFLRVEGPAGSGFVAADDDGAFDGLASRITFVPPVTGAY